MTAKIHTIGIKARFIEGTHDMGVPSDVLTKAMNQAYQSKRIRDGTRDSRKLLSIFGSYNQMLNINLTQFIIGIKCF